MPDDNEYDYTCPNHGVTFDLVSEDGITDRYYSLGEDQVLLLSRIDRPIPYLHNKNITENIMDWQFVVASYRDESMTFTVLNVESDWMSVTDEFGL